jgi:hypothetical protein
MFEPGTDGAHPGVREAQAALRLAPNKPGVLFTAGKIVLVNTVNRGQSPEESGAWDFVNDCFRRAIASDETYAERIYSLVQSTLGGADALFAVTPETIRGCESLTNALWERKRWDDVLRSLERARICCEGSSGEDALISISRRRATVLGILGRFEERRSESLRLRSLLRRSSEEALREARRQRDNLRHADALLTVIEVLRSDWANPDALILAADLARMPDARAAADSQDGSLDYLFRLVVLNASIDPALCGEVLRILDRSGAPFDGEERLLAGLIRGAALVRSGRCRDGADALERLVQEIEGSEDRWDRTHLVWYNLGLAYEECGEAGKAAAAYACTLQEAPAHGGAARRLRSLVPGTLPPLPEPEVAAGVGFGGKIVLRGITLDRASAGERAAAGGTDGTCRATLYWEVVDRLADNCRAKIQILDDDMEAAREQSVLLLDMDARPEAAPLPGEIIVDTLELPLADSRSGYIAIRIRPRNAPLLVADNGELSLMVKMSSL